MQSFTREVDGVTETTVIGARATPEETWFEAEERMTFDGGDCAPENVFVRGEALGGVSDAFPGWGLAASEISHRHEGSTTYSVRAYGYTHGHMVIVWVEQPHSKPDTDRVVELLNKQADKIADNS